MKPLVFDATPLIYLAKAGLLAKLKYLKNKKIIPKSVFDEVVTRGLLKEHEDAKIIEKLVTDKIFTIQKSSDLNMLKNFEADTNIETADAEVLAIAKKNGGIAIIDDSNARIFAEAERIEVKGTVFLLFRLFKIGELNKNKLKDKFNFIIENGWFCSVDFYAAVMAEIEKL